MTDTSRPGTASTIKLDGGRDVRVHWAGSGDRSGPVLLMNYGTPHTGSHPARIDRIAQRLGLQLVSVTRPGFPGSDRLVGRSVAEAVEDIVKVVDLIGITRLSVAGYSGGGPHALALAAALGDRVDRVVAVASPAPFTGEQSWFHGMAGNGAGLRAALGGLQARETYQRETSFDPAAFTAADVAALEGRWADIAIDGGAATRAGSDAGEVDDDLAFIAPWGVDLGGVTADVTLVQAEEDRIIPEKHCHILASQIQRTHVQLLNRSGHIAALDALPAWMEQID